MFNAGLVSVSFRENTTQEILCRMQKAKLDKIEWGSDVHAPCNDINKLKKTAELQSAFGVTCVSYGTYFKLGVTPLEELERYISAAFILGTNVLRVWAGDKPFCKYTSSEKERLFQVCRKAEQIASKNNAVLCMECHNGTFTDCTEGTLELMKAVGSNRFEMFWQPNQYKSFEYNLDYAKAIAHYVRNIHVFNWDADNKYPLADGTEKWQKYLSCFSGTHNCMLEFMPNGSIDSLCEEAKALHKIIQCL